MRRIWLGLITIALGAAACGGGATTQAEGDGTTGSVSAGTAGSVNTGDFCGQARELEKIGEAFQNSDLGNMQDPAALDSAIADLDNAKVQVRAMASASPSEIRADMEIMANAFEVMVPLLQEFVTAMQDIGDDAAAASGAAMAKLTEIAQRMETELDQEQLQAAGERITKYFADECGVNLDLGE